MVNLAVTLAGQSRLAEAESELEKALKIEPGNEHAQTVLAENTDPTKSAKVKTVN